MGSTKLSLHDHHEQRRRFAYLDDIAPGDIEALGAVWIRLKILLEGHAAAEEEREDLANFRLHADLKLRHDIAVAFAVFEARHTGGIRARDHEPQEYIENPTAAC